MPVLGSGHPQADVFLLKHAPMPSEVEEGVAFYGRSGTALMKALKRLQVDPLAVYGTLCVKCPVGDPSLADPACVARVVEELAIVQPKVVVVMGEDALAALNDLDVPLAKPLEYVPGAPPAAHAVDRRDRDAEHRRVPRRGGRQARLLVGLPGPGRVVRGPAAVLALLAAAQAYFLAAPSLPVIGDVDTSILVACTVGSAFIFICVACVIPVTDSPPLLMMLTVGAFGLVAGFNVANFGAAATPIEAIAYAAFGGIFAVGLLAPSLALALPVFVAAIDVVSTFAGGPSEVLANAGQTQPGDPLSLEMPDWGNGLPAGRLGISDVVFAGVFLVFARRYRPAPTGDGGGAVAGDRPGDRVEDRAGHGDPGAAAAGGGVLPGQRRSPAGVAAAGERRLIRGRRRRARGCLRGRRSRCRT